MHSLEQKKALQQPYLVDNSLVSNVDSSETDLQDSKNSKQQDAGNHNSNPKTIPNLILLIPERLKQAPFLFLWYPMPEIISTHAQPLYLRPDTLTSD